MILCELCHVRRAVDPHHRLPRGRGGTDDDLNIIHLCRGCHSWIEHHPTEARERGLTVPGFVLRGTYHGPDETYREHFNG